MSTILKNPSEGRLRSGWRILFFILIFWSATLLIFIVKPLFPEVSKKVFIDEYSVIVIAIIALSATLSTLFARKYFDKKSIRSLGLSFNKNTLQDLVFGFLLSGLMAGCFFLIQYFSGIISLEGIELSTTNWPPNLGTDFIQFMSIASIGSLSIYFLEMLLVGYWEELVFRGYLFKNLQDGLGLKTAILISCLLYGIIHMSNPNATYLSSAIIIIFGFLRLYGLLSTKLLWLSMGMHIGWNRCRD